MVDEKFFMIAINKTMKGLDTVESLLAGARG
jgi:hypothetical protein